MDKSKEIWEAVIQNNKLLDSCDGHVFSIDVTLDKTFGKRWKCKKCRGEIDNINKYWYEQGLKHNKK